MFSVVGSFEALFAARFVGGLAAGLVWSAALTACHLASAGRGNMGALFGVVLSSVSVRAAPAAHLPASARPRAAPRLKKRAG